MAGQLIEDENKTALKRKASSSKKIYIRNYFTRARSGVGEGEPVTYMDDLDPQAPVIPPSPILEHDPDRRPTQRAQTRTRTGAGARAGLHQLCDKLWYGSSIIGELVELADTALEESWDSPKGKSNGKKNNDKNTICGELKEAI
ncbi:hypothetical protein NDU88_001373 [Pleurodeles waltl]|uniref:Uncharacterized protein n=1 Tax=Pleurodeles waltl TaxID=8319 RepID=A0AAV7M811_PLEWA|nr:hypothetical protein NDU88_001373 [Pleurodeles waltl]